MKVGDLVQLDGYLYPQYKGKLGVIVEPFPTQGPPGWIVMIKGRLHPYKITEDDMEVYDENR